MNKKTWRMSLVLIAALVVAVAGCGKQSKPAPVEINEGTDKCDVCNMSVANDHNASEIILKNGKALKFDDIGDMFAWTKKNGMNDVEVRYVRDFASKEWIDLNDATFAYDKMFKTPMAYGVYSFKDKKDAEAYVAEQKMGQVMTAKDLDSHTWEMNMDQKKGHGAADHGDSHGGEGAEKKDMENKSGH